MAQLLISGFSLSGSWVGTLWACGQQRTLLPWTSWRGYWWGYKSARFRLLNKYLMPVQYIQGRSYSYNDGDTSKVLQDVSQCWQLRQVFFFLSLCPFHFVLCALSQQACWLIWTVPTQSRRKMWTECTSATTWKSPRYLDKTHHICRGNKKLSKKVVDV